jgi:hypothetical protein
VARNASRLDVSPFVFFLFWELTRVSEGVGVHSRSVHQRLLISEFQKTHKVIHEIATPRQTSSDGSIVNSVFFVQP